MVKKLPGRGFEQQTIAFVIGETNCVSPAFNALVESAETVAYVSSTTIDGVYPYRVLSCAITALPKAMSFYSGQFMTLASPALGYEEYDTFTLRLDGPMNYAIWRRVNIETLKRMAGDGQPWLLRKFGRYQLKKYERERASEEPKEDM